MRPCVQDGGSHLVVPLVKAMVLMVCMFVCGCTSDEIGDPATVTVNAKSQSHQRIEHLIGIELPASVTKCRYHSDAVGWDGCITHAYFELPTGDVDALLGRAPKLPNAGEFGSDPGRWDFGSARDRGRAVISWWQPLELQDRRFAVSKEENLAWQMYICLGPTDAGRTGLYICYTAG